MSDVTRVAIASDHAGFALKQQLVEALKEWGVAYEDLGCHSEASVDYPDFAHSVAEGITSGKFGRGILVCGTGIGMSMSANRHQGVRAAVCSEAFSARMTRLHNDANVICLGARVVGVGVARDIVEAFLKTEFEGGRHSRRVDKIDA
jgi:ribose 5-phosphate isomerase B